MVNFFVHDDDAVAGFVWAFKDLTKNDETEVFVLDLKKTFS